jgi:O-antigen/teichoic acid export membrane protein
VRFFDAKRILLTLRRNILASFVGQIYVAIISIVMVPFYVRYLGAEAYGLIGFFAMLQAWFQLLDMGLSPTMARETARYSGATSEALSLRRLLRALEVIFIGVAVLGAAGIILAADTIASQWLKVQQLPLGEVRNAIMLMALIVDLRWTCGLYRGAITGFERIVWLNGFNVGITTARFVFVIPVFLLVGTRPTVFFGYQLLIALIEVAVLINQAYRLLPKVGNSQKLAVHWASLRSLLKFSLSIAFTGSIWVVVTQTDKLLLSKILPLADYAYFTLAVLVASGVMVISSPISVALLPRLTKLNATGDEAGLIQLYRDATQMVGVIAIPTSLVLAFFAEQVLWVWTGNLDIAQKAAPILTLYAVGNGILALGAFPYYLQYAKGDLKLHLIGNAIFIVLLLPTLIWATRQFGVVGAGYTWVGVNSLYFLLWLPKVHGRFSESLHLKWLLFDVTPIALSSGLGAVLLWKSMAWPSDRFLAAAQLFGLAITLVGLSALSSKSLRRRILATWCN